VFLQGRRFSELFNDRPALTLNIFQTRVEEERRMDMRLSLLGVVPQSHRWFTQHQLGRGQENPCIGKGLVRN
jgi:hypothetical protein